MSELKTFSDEITPVSPDGVKPVDGGITPPPVETPLATHPTDGSDHVQTPEETSVSLWDRIALWTTTAAPVVGSIVKLGLGIAGTFYPPAAAALVAITAGEKLLSPSSTPMDSTSKPIWQSKTLWFNVLMFLWRFIGPKVGIPELDDTTFAGIITVANVVLRFITKQPVTIS